MFFRVSLSTEHRPGRAYIRAQYIEIVLPLLAYFLQKVAPLGFG